MHNLKIGLGSQQIDENEATRNCNSFQPSIPIEDIFQQMFELELRDGKLSPKRRKRLVQYAAQMGLSARQAGMLMERTYQRAIEDGVEPTLGYALRLANPPRSRISEPVRIALIITVSLIVDTLLIYWLW